MQGTPLAESDVARNGRRGRLAELDTLRALACGAVVVWHLLQFAARNAPVAERAVWLAVSQCFVLGGPVFFFLSAFLCFHRHKEGEPGGLRDYWMRRLLVVVLPTVVWSLACLALELPRFRGMTAADTARAIGLALVLGVGHLAFVNALLQFYLVFPVLRWVWQRGERWSLTASAFTLGVAWMLGGRPYLPADLPPGVAFPLTGCLLGWLPYVALGALAAEHPERLGRLVPRPAGMWASLLGAGSLVAVWFYALGPGRALGPIPYAGAVRPEVLIAALFWLPFVLHFAHRSRSGVLASLCREGSALAPAVFFTHLVPLKLASLLVPVTWGADAVFTVYVATTVGGTALLLRLLHRSPAALLMTGVVRRSRRPPRDEAAAPTAEAAPVRIAAGW